MFNTYYMKSIFKNNIYKKKKTIALCMENYWIYLCYLRSRDFFGALTSIYFITASSTISFPARRLSKRSLTSISGLIPVPTNSRLSGYVFFNVQILQDKPGIRGKFTGFPAFYFPNTIQTIHSALFTSRKSNIIRQQNNVKYTKQTGAVP